MRHVRSRFLVVAFLTLGLSCAHGGSPAARLADAAKSADAKDASARTLALAGFHALLVDSDSLRAQARFDAALALDGADPYARTGRMLLAQRAGHPEDSLEHALLLLEHGPPRHPLQMTAAREVVEVVGQSLALDDLILARAPAALARGLPGEAAHLLRNAVAAIALERGDAQRLETMRQEMGAPNAVTWAGPFTPFRALSFDDVTPPERDGSLQGPWKGPLGTLTPRTLSFLDGRIQAAGEPPPGDGYVAAVDVEVHEPALHVLRTVGAASHRVTLDGALLIARRGFVRTEPTVSAIGVHLSAGRHRLVLRLLGDERGGVSISLPRADGRPASVRFFPAQGQAPQWGGISGGEAPGFYPQATHLAAALKDEAGEGLAIFLAARDAVGRDRDGVKALLVSLAASLPGAMVSTLRAQVALGDRGLPARVSRGRATRDLEAALESDPKNVEALLMRANAALDESRLPEASNLLERAREASTPVGYPVRLLEARLGLALNVDAQAEVAAEAALVAQPRLCDALSIRFELAQRRDAAKKADDLLATLRGCPGALARSVEHARTRGNLTQALAWAEALVAREPTSVPAILRLAGLFLAQRKVPPALAALREGQRQWPREPSLKKREAEALATAGDAKGALAARQAALLLDGDDLQLRRLVERATTGKELLQEFAVEGRKAIASYQAKPGAEEAAGAYVLDAAASRGYRDGSVVDRIHVIQKVLDQSAVTEIAEVNIPPGAHVLALRTLKADGRVLEPESFEGKDAISLPGVAVGDYVEYEYLLAHGPRGPALPGFTASNFYFQIARQPDHWVTYTVAAPKGSGLKVDAHHLQAPDPQTLGDEEVFQLTLRDSPPFIPEPDSPPSMNEYLPFVSVGAGAEGNEGLMSAYADALLDRGRLTHEVVAFAREAAGNRSGDARVLAVYDAVMQKVSGREEGLGVSAAASLAQERGSRLWLLKAALEALGIEARVALVRPFSADPAYYRFPSETLYSYAVLRVTAPGAAPRWLDPTIRFAPAGELPEQVAGGREALLLPEPGRPLEKARTPPPNERPGKQVTLELVLDPKGNLSGTGLERYHGLEAAQLAEALEALSPGERDQALQSALTRFFGGAELSEIKVERDRAVGAPLLVRYRLRAAGFARVEDGRLILPPVTFPATLGRRYVQLSQRRTALFIDDTERNTVKVSLRVPAGYKLSGAVGDVKTGSAFGSVRRQESQKGDLVAIDEEYRLFMARISPERYEEFSQFAGEVDLLQSRDLVVEPPAGKGKGEPARAERP